MLKTTLLTAVLVMATSGLARAGGQEGTIGVGAEFQINGIVGGPSLNYDAGAFHVGGSIGFGDNLGMMSNDFFQVGARFYYHVHSTAMADFGLGGALGIDSVDTGPDRISLIFVEPGLQIRAFIAANVALSFSAGIVLGVSDADGVAITGQGTGFNAGGGVHYYFF